MAISSIRFSAVPEATPGADEPRHISRRVKVVARLPIGRGLIFEISDRADGHHLPADVTDFQPRNVLGTLAELFVCLNHNLMGAVQVVEVVHIRRTHVKLERREHVGWCKPYLLGLLAVDVDVERRSA